MFIADNLNSHGGERLVRMVAENCGISENEPGQVEKHGVLKDMASRRAYLSDESHRVRFVSLPKHSSWLIQIEAVFRMFNRRVRPGGSFTSKEELMEKLRSFTEYFNKTIAKPMEWTFTGRPTEIESLDSPKTSREMWTFRHLRKLRQKPEGTSGSWHQLRRAVA